MSTVPGTVLFPLALDNADSLIQAKNNAFTTILDSMPNDTTTITSLAVVSVSGFPSSGALSIEDEILFYEGVDSSINAFLNCHRAQDESAAAAHAVGVVAELRIVAAFHNTLSSAICAVETKLGSAATASTPNNGLLLQGFAPDTLHPSGISTWTDKVGIGVAPSTMRSLNVAGNFPAELVGQCAGAWIAPTFNSYSTVAVYGLNVAPTFASTVDGHSLNVFYGILSNPTIVGTPTPATTPITSFSNISAALTHNGSSTINVYRGAFIRNPAGTGPINTAYGLYVEGITRGSSANYAIYSQAGPNYFGGFTGIGVTPSTTALLNLATTFATSGSSSSYGINSNITVSNAATGSIYGLNSNLNITAQLAGTTYGHNNNLSINHSDIPSSSWACYGDFITLNLTSIYEIGTICGSRIAVFHSGTSTVNNHTGLQVSASSAATTGSTTSNLVIGGTFGMSKGGSSQWTVGSAKLLAVQAPTGNIVGTSLYGLYMENLSGSVGTWTNKYALYIMGGTSYHAGSFGIGTNTPTSSLHVAGSFATATATKTGNYTLTSSDSVILVNNTTTAATITLPGASTCPGRCYTVKRLNATYSVTLASSDNIDGSGTFVLGSLNDRVTVVSTGSTWFII